jgi:hypothetical protein
MSFWYLFSFLVNNIFILVFSVIQLNGNYVDGPVVQFTLKKHVTLFFDKYVFLTSLDVVAGPKCGSQMGVPNGGPKWGSQMGVPNGGPNQGPISGFHITLCLEMSK